MTRSKESALLAIEVQPRYRDLLSGVWPVVANPEPDELISSWLHRLAFGNGLPREDVRTGSRSGFRRLVRQTRSRAAGDRARSAGPLHGPRFRSRRRHDARRGWRALSLVADARRSFAGPAGASASRVAAILSALSGRRRATLFPEGMAPGDDDRLRASREPPARPLPVQSGVAAAPERLRRLRLQSRQREGAVS